MDRKIIEAAAETGDVDKLHNLIKDYPLMLKNVALSSGDTPLHMACIGGHVHFVKEVLNLRPEFTVELNNQGLSPLHIASAHGDVEIVEELLIKVGSQDLCLLQGNDDRIPLHSAVVKGRVEVIKVLVSACQDSITRVTARGESCFHLAVKNKQFKAFKVLYELVVMQNAQEILNHKDGQGNTILHLAASTKQYQVVDLLLDKNVIEVEVNALNKKGLTPLDVLLSQGRDDNCEIDEMLILAGAGATTILVSPSQNQQVQEQRIDRPKSAFPKLWAFFKYDRVKRTPSKARSTMLVMSVLIATATYSAVLSPPGGVWQDDLWPVSNDKQQQQQPPAHTAGKAVMATHTPVCYCVFLVFNSLGLFISVQMMLLLCLGLPLRFEFRTAFFALGVTYVACLIAITPTAILFMLVFVLTLIPLTTPALAVVVKYLRKRYHPEWKENSRKVSCSVQV